MQLTCHVNNKIFNVKHLKMQKQRFVSTFMLGKIIN